MNKKMRALVSDAIMIAMRPEIEKMNSYPIIDTPHSEAFNESMQKLMYAPKTLKNPRIVWTPRKIAAVILAGALIIAALTACAIYKAKNGFFENTFELFTEFSEHDDNGFIDSAFYPAYIPDGYDLVKTTKTLTVIQTKWACGNDRIVFSQHSLNDIKITLDTEDTSYTTEDIGKYAVSYVRKSGTYYAVWRNEKYAFTLSCPESIEKEDFRKIIEGVSPDN